MSGFTKGPWAWREDEYTDADGSAFLMTNHGEDANIAAGRSWDQDLVILAVDYWDLPAADEANVKAVIAAAPLMHEVLTSVLADIEGGMVTQGTVNEIRHALAKANGND